MISTSTSPDDKETDAVADVLGVVKDELHTGMVAPESGDDGGDEPGAERELEGDADQAPLGVDELGDGGEAVVEVDDERVDVPLEGRSGVGEPENSPRAAQQRRPDLPLEPGERSRDGGLAHPVDLAHLGHRHAVGDLLEPAEHIGLHIHDASA